MMRTFLNILVLLLLLSTPAWATGPVETARLFFGELISVATLPNLESRKARVQSLVNQHFQFDSFYEKSLVDHWKGWTMDQKINFDRSFRVRFIDHLSRHLSRIERIIGSEVSYRIVQVSKDRAEVNAIGRRDEHQIGVRLFLVRNDGVWKVYDLDIAGANLARNYRGRFNFVLRKEGYEGLLAKLER